ncbi:MAG: hypothetical protein ABSD10_02705 [Candidatus Saccharimonadales bacterium]
MKLANFLHYVLLPILALSAGVKLGIKYAQETYVSKDRKFINGEVIDKEKKQ